MSIFNHVKATDIRKAAVAGMFYPGEKQALKQQIDQLLSSASSKRVDGKILGIISPHAGYVYSGPVAAEAFNQLRGKQYDVVVVIAPSHREYIAGVSIFNGSAYETPLGSVPIEFDLANKMIDSDEKIISSFAGHHQEHSLEVQLPFLQSVLVEFKLIPIVMGEQDYDICKTLGITLSNVLKEYNALIVGSSDLSHFHSYSEAERLDSIIVDHINHFDDEALAQDLKSGTCEACGGGPMISTMIACKQLGANKMSVLKYMNSGDITGDRHEVVGYLSAAIYQ